MKCIFSNKSVERFIAANRLPHLLFYGPPGTGKTSTILAVARKIYGKSYKSMLLEVQSGIFSVNISLGIKLIVS